MSDVTLWIDGTQVTAEEGTTLLRATLDAGVYIPHLCSHPDLPAFDAAGPTDAICRGGEKVMARDGAAYEGCGFCAVQVEGEEGFTLACHTPVAEKMRVSTESPELAVERKKKLAAILSHHPHACLTCAQQEGCSLTQCSSNVPEDLRCCEQFNRCELRKVSDFIGIPQDVPRYAFKNLPKIMDEPLFDRDHNLCIGCTRCVRACANTHGESVIGYVHDRDGFVVGPLAETLRESGCRFCGMCVEVCPTGALTDRDVQWARREEKLLPCRHTCPIELDVPEYSRFIANEDFESAAKVIRAKTPLAAVLGMVCFHPCEDVCRRGKVSEPLAICALKRFAMEQAGDGDATPAIDHTGKKAAIIGSGPAGLTAAHFLASKGHGVTLFEAMDQPGGMLRYGIPSYRLPVDVLDKQIDAILSNELVELKTGSRVGDSVGFEALRNDGFDAVLVTVGLQQGKDLPADGCESIRVRQGTEFLRSAAMGEFSGAFFNGKRVVVIGGGNVAIDAARTSIRLGAEQVDQVCLESCDEMPAHEYEVEQAEQEGVRFHHSLGVRKIAAKEGSCIDLEMMACCSVFDEAGKFNPSFNEDVTSALDADEIIAAIGQEADLSFFEGDKPSVDNAGSIQVDRETMETSVKGVFAAGDVANGPASVVEAIATGRKAAQAIDRLFGGDGDLEIETPAGAERFYLGRAAGFGDLPRTPMPCLAPDERKRDFTAVEMGFDTESAMAEAKRCLGCDLRLRLSEFVPPPVNWMEFNASNVDTVPEADGVFQLLDESKVVLSITGTSNLRQELNEKLQDGSNARFFLFELDPMYSKRESELIQQYIQEHGEMPGGDDEDMDDLF